MIMESWNMAQVLWIDRELRLSNLRLLTKEPVPEGGFSPFLSLDILVFYEVVIEQKLK
jgi:hypothetical protein